jgi:hypothetical protein
MPDHVLIADGGSPSDFERDIRDYIRGRKNISYNVMRGRCNDTRRKALDKLVWHDCFVTDIIAFIDADEIGKEDWLENLIAPIEAGRADFTGGPWQPTKEKSRPEHILNKIQMNNMLLASKNPAYIAMGNSAWSVDIFKKIGNLDASSESETADEMLGKEGIVAGHYVSEDFDLNIRAIAAGFRGMFVPNAIVYHDQSHVNTYLKLTKYFYNNYVRAGMAYFKNGEGMGKFIRASRQPISHPFEVFLLMLKPVAFVNAWREYNKLCR